MTEERKALAFTKYEYKGFPVSFTIRGDSISEVLDSMEAQIDSLLERGQVAFVERLNINAPERDDRGQIVPGEPAPALENDKVTGSYLGLLPYAPKSSELKSGQTYELTVDSYVLKDGEIQFWKKGSEYPSHTHKLNDVGVKVMADLFGGDWDKYFKASGDLQSIPKGDLIIKIEGSQKTTKHGNPYKNLVGQRRP